MPLSLTGQDAGSRLPLTAQASLALFPVGVTWKQIFLGFLMEEDLRKAAIREGGATSNRDTIEKTDGPPLLLKGGGAVRFFFYIIYLRGVGKTKVFL